MKNGRCRMHGGKSAGPPKGNRNAWKHGNFSAQARARRVLLKYLSRIAPARLNQPIAARGQLREADIARVQNPLKVRVRDARHLISISWLSLSPARAGAIPAPPLPDWEVSLKASLINAA